jgi:hypothetical protein
VHNRIAYRVRCAYEDVPKEDAVRQFSLEESEFIDEASEVWRTSSSLYQAPRFRLHGLRRELTL